MTCKFSFETTLLFFVILFSSIQLCSCANPSDSDSDSSDLPLVHTPVKAERPYWFFNATTGSYRYSVYEKGTSVSEDSCLWTEFDAAEESECPVYNTADDFLFLSDDFPAGPARITASGQIYVCALSTLSVTEGSVYAVLLEKKNGSSWNALETGTVTIDTTVPDVPAVSEDFSSVDSELCPVWEWTGPSDAVRFICGLYESGADTPADRTVVSAKTVSGSTSATASYQPPEDLDLTNTWTYILSVQSVDAAGNRSDAVEIKKLIVPAASYLVPAVSSGKASATASRTPSWTWSVSEKLPVSSYRYQLYNGESSALINDSLWISTSETSFTAGSDKPYSGGNAVSLDDGEWTLFVEAYYASIDTWSEAGSCTVTVSSDIPPDPVFDSETDTTVHTSEPVWSWTVADREDVVTGYTYTLTYTSTDTDPVSISGSVNDVSGTSRFSYTAEKSLPEGTAGLEVHTLNKDGILSENSASFTYVLDFTEPAVMSLSSDSTTFASVTEVSESGSDISYYPVAPVFTAAFSEVMDESSVRNALSLTAGTKQVEITVEVVSGSGGADFTIAPASCLPENTVCTLSLSTTAEDTAGNCITSGKSIVFTTGVSITNDSTFSSYIPDSNLRNVLLDSGTAYLHQVKSIVAVAGTYSENITDLTGISLCKSLETVNLTYKTSSSSDAVTGGSDLAECAALKDLTLTDCPYSINCSWIPSSVCTLDLSGSQLENGTTASVSLLTGLQSLKVSDCGLTDISFLSGLTNLTYLDLSGNSFTSTDALTKSDSLETLVVSDCGLTDVSFLTGLVKLTYLDLSKNGIKNLADFPNTAMANLVYLILSGNESLSSIKGLSFSSLPKLTTALFSGCGLSGTIDLSGCTFKGTETSFEDSDSTSFSFIDLSHNSISGIEKIPEDTSLQRIDVSKNGLSSVSWAESRTSLRYINISNNQNLADAGDIVTSLGSLCKIEEINLGGITFPSGSTVVNDLIAALNKLGLDGSSIVEN
jgi:Leucine-rich repeat (LRR) protein